MPPDPPTNAGQATLSWEAPTLNVDGSPLTDLAGFQIAWGDVPGQYVNFITVMNPGVTSYLVENLASGSHYFAVAAINSVGYQSEWSNEVPVTIGLPSSVTLICDTTVSPWSCAPQ